MKKNQSYLEQLGFSHLEANIYLTLLKSGPMTVRQLADAVKLNRTAAYTHINSLLENGIILSIRQGPRKQLVPIEPDRLQHLIDNKLAGVKSLQAQFPGFVSSLETAITYRKNESNVDVKYYKGLQGVNEVYKDMFKANEVKVYCRLSEIAPLFPKEPDILSRR